MFCDIPPIRAPPPSPRPFLVTPFQCRLRDCTYSAPLWVNVRYTRGRQIVNKTNINIGRIPVMLLRCACGCRLRNTARNPALSQRDNSFYQGSTNSPQHLCCLQTHLVHDDAHLGGGDLKKIPSTIYLSMRMAVPTSAALVGVQNLSAAEISSVGRGLMRCGCGDPARRSCDGQSAA